MQSIRRCPRTAYSSHSLHSAFLLNFSQLSTINFPGHRSLVTFRNPNSSIYLYISDELKDLASLAWFGCRLGVGNRGRNRRYRADNHIGPLAADQWLVRFVLRFIGVSSYRVASEKIRRC
jgi:hypothetical protein